MAENTDKVRLNSIIEEGHDLKTQSGDSVVIEESHDLKTQSGDSVVIEESHDLKTQSGDSVVDTDIAQECKRTKANEEASLGENKVEVSTKMNDKIKFEVVGLFKQGLVSRALGGSNFRNKLESALQDAVETHIEKEPAQRGRGKKTKTRIRSRVREEENAMPEVETPDRSSPRPSRRALTSRASPNTRRPAYASTPHRHRPRTGYRRNTVTASLPDEIGQRLNRYSLSEHQRETIVTDLRNLVSNQLVSTSLEGEFRGTLELHLRGRAERIEDGMTPEDIVEEVQRQAGTETQRPTRTADVNSFTATASIPVSSGNSQAMRDLTRQVEEMRQQMSEMQRMMRVSFEVQQYVQRSIRQEVAASMQSWSTHNCGGPGVAPEASVKIAPTVPNVTTSGEPAPETTVPAVYGTCVVCTQNKIDSVVYRCGHMCVCQPCGYELISGNHKCPMCRSPITDIIRVYKTSA